jgi:hypothetical protein
LIDQAKIAIFVAGYNSPQASATFQVTTGILACGYLLSTLAVGDAVAHHRSLWTGRFWQLLWLLTLRYQRSISASFSSRLASELVEFRRNSHTQEPAGYTCSG